MPHDPELVAETRAWLARARNDLEAATFEETARPPFTADIAFHAQQAVEKSMKAFLTWLGQPFRKTHSLEELGEQCLALDPGLRELVDLAVPLTEFAWKFRYPGDAEDPVPDEAGEALRVAREVYQAITARLPREVRP